MPKLDGSEPCSGIDMSQYLAGYIRHTQARDPSKRKWMLTFCCRVRKPGGFWNGVKSKECVDGFNEPNGREGVCKWPTPVKDPQTYEEALVVLEAARLEWLRFDAEYQLAHSKGPMVEPGLVKRALKRFQQGRKDYYVKLDIVKRLWAVETIESAHV